MLDLRAIAIGGVVGGTVGLALGLGLGSSDVPILLFAVLVFALIGLISGAGWRRFRREQRRAIRWTWPLALGAALGLSGGVYARQVPIQTSVPPIAELVVAFVLLPLAGVLAAAAAERIAVGPDGPGAKRLGTFLFASPRHAGWTLLGSVTGAIVATAQNVHAAPLGAGTGSVLGWWLYDLAAELLGEVRSALRPGPGRRARIAWLAFGLVVLTTILVAALYDAATGADPTHSPPVSGP